MIPCKHKYPMEILNRGLTIQFCSLFGQSVNEDICSSCSSREGEMTKEPIEMDFPRRTPEEIGIIYDTCKACPLHHLVKKTCKKALYEAHPTDIVAQHPSSHCPEDKW